jgi:hypothetical protein
MRHLLQPVILSQHDQLLLSKRKKEAKDKDERTYEIRIPHPDDIPHAQFAHQEAVHPSESELDELDGLGGEVGC